MLRILEDLWFVTTKMGCIKVTVER